LKTKELFVVGLIDQRSILSQINKATILMSRKHLINIVEAVTERGFLRDEGRKLDVEEIFDKPRRGYDKERISENLQKIRGTQRSFPSDIMAWHEGGQSAKSECL
jgi:hypothetical protein